ncbi:hypothetical protein D3C76_1709830 [compost metagenome]
MNGVCQLHVDGVVQIGLEEGQGLTEVEAQIRDVYLAKLGHRTQATEFQIEIHAGGQHHMKLGWGAIHQYL